jgi:hypothetical protein
MCSSALAVVANAAAKWSTTAQTKNTLHIYIEHCAIAPGM